MKRIMTDRRQFVLGGTGAIAAAAMFGLAGCAGSGNTGAASGASAASGAKNNGKVDIKNACYGQDTPGLVSLDESINYNRLEFSESEKSKTPAITQDTIPYLHAEDYGKQVDLKIELLTPATAKAGETPLIVWINGGGFTTSDAAKNINMRLTLAQAGYVVASVQHRTSATSNFPKPLQDIKAAIRFLKAGAETYKFNPNKVAVAGNSSGGYYASMIGVTSNVATVPWPNAKGETEDVALDVGANLDQSSAVNCVVDFYGVSDLTIIGAGLADALQESHHSPATTEAILLNGAAAAKKGVGVFDPSMDAKVSVASPFSYICATTPPFLLLHGTADTLVSPVATKMLQDRLTQAGVAADRFVIEGAGHGTPQFEQAAVHERVLKFFEANAGNDVVTAAPVIDWAKGTQAYAAADLPTLEDACAGAEKVEIDPENWVITQVKDISYKMVADKNSYVILKMNMLLPSVGKEDPARPVLFCAVCGGFNKSNPSALSYLRYAQRGYAVATAEIRVVPNAKMPVPIQDAKAAVRWLRAHAKDYNIDPNCIIATGTSAGGYMGVMLGVLGNTAQYNDDIKFDVGDNLDQSSAVQGVLDFYGVSDLTIIGAGLPNYDVHDSASNTEALWVNGTAFGDNPGGSVFADMDKTAIFSPFTYLDKDDAPFLLFHGTEDVIVSPISTMEIYKRCKDLGVQAERYSIVGAGHGGWQMSTDRVYAIVDDFMDGIVAANAKK